VIGLDGRGAGFVNGVDVINDGGFDNVKVIGTNSHDTLDFSDVQFNSNFEIDGRKGNDTITTSDESAGEYRGSQDNDTFVIGDADATFLYKGNDNGFDSFPAGGPAGEFNGLGTSTILAEADNTVIGLDGRGAGFVNGVDVIDDGDKIGVTVIGTNSHDTLNFSAVTFASDLTIDSRKGNDTVTTALDHTGDTVLYDGGPGNDTLVISATLSDISDAEVDPSDGIDATEADDLADVLGFSHQNFENFAIALHITGSTIEVFADNTFTVDNGLPSEGPKYPTSSLASVTLLGDAGDNTFNVNVHPDGIGPAIFIVGGAGNDELNVVLTANGGSVSTTHLGSTVDGFFGTTTVTGGGQTSIGWSGLEPLTIGGNQAVNIDITLPATSDSATLEQSGSTFTLSGPTFETTTFNTPSSSVTINGGDGDDRLDIDSTINMGAALNLDIEDLNVTRDVTVGAFSSTGTTFDTGSNDDIQTTNGGISIDATDGIDARGLLDAKNSGAATITLTSAGNVSVNSFVKTDGGIFTSSGTDLTVGGVINTSGGAVDFDGHSGAMLLKGDVTAGSFTANTPTSFKMNANDDIRVSNGNITIETNNGNIDIGGLLDAKNSGVATIMLTSNGFVNVSSSVKTDGGNLTSSGTDLTVGGVINTSGGAVDFDGHSGAMLLKGDVTAGSFTANTPTSFKTNANDDIRTSSGNITIKTTTGDIDIGGLLDAKGGAITLDSAGNVSVSNSIKTDGGDLTSSGDDLTVGGVINTSGGNITLNHGNVTLGADVNTGGGDFSSGNGTGALNTGNNDDIRTSGGSATFNHTTVDIGGVLDTSGSAAGAIHITFHVDHDNPPAGPLFQVNGTLDFSGGHTFHIEATGFDPGESLDVHFISADSIVGLASRFSADSVNGAALDDDGEDDELESTDALDSLFTDGGDVLGLLFGFDDD